MTTAALVLLAGKEKIAERTSMTVIPMVAYMEELALYVWIVMLCFIISMLIGWCGQFHLCLYCWIHWEHLSN